jgi:hypothetical protein
MIKKIEKNTVAHGSAALYDDIRLMKSCSCRFLDEYFRLQNKNRGRTTLYKTAPGSPTKLNADLRNGGASELYCSPVFRPTPRHIGTQRPPKHTRNLPLPCALRIPLQGPRTVCQACQFGGCPECEGVSINFDENTTLELCL